MTPEAAIQESVTQKPAPVKASAKKATRTKRASKKSRPKKTAAKKKVAKKRARKKPVVAKKPASKKRKAKKQPVKHATTKAQSIRDAAKELGKKARPRHIIAALAEKGIRVVSAQVSTVLKAAGLRRGRRRRTATAAAGAKQHSGNGHALNITELVRVKILADQLGGTDRLKEAVAALERLL